MADQVALRISGQDAGATALLRLLSRQTRLYEQELGRLAGAQRGAGAAAAQAATQERTLLGTRQQGAAALRGLATRVLAVASAYVGLRTAVAGVRQGLNVNAELEQTALGIASIIAAQTEMTDSTGRALTAAERLTAAQAVSEEQMRKLRIAGLQTAATFQELAAGFQQAVGPGLAAGLDLDQIRELTIGVTQAATALGVPTHQISQEVRAILSGTIDINARVAQTLQITRAQVLAERQRGTLYTFLVSRLEAFNAAGKQAEGTFRGVAAQARELVEVFAGEATEPLFVRLREAGRRAIDQIFDVDTASIRPQFQVLVDEARRVFEGIGDGVGQAIANGVQRAAELGEWLREHRTQIGAFVTDARAAGGAVAGIVRQAALLTRDLIRAAEQGGVLRASLVTIESVASLAAGAIRLIRDNLTAVVAILTGAALAKGIAMIGGLSALPTAIGLGGLALLANPVTVAAVAVGGLVVAIDAYRRAQQRAREETIRSLSAQTRVTREAPALVAEYQRLAQEIESGALKGEELRKAQDRIRTVKDQILQLSPDFRSALADETQKLTEQAAEAKKVADELERARQQKVQDRRATLSQLEAEQRALEARLAAGPSRAPLSAAAADREMLRQGRDASRLPQLKDEIAQVRAELVALGEEADKPFVLRPQVVTQVEGRTNTTTKPPDAETAEQLRARLRALAQIAEREERRRFERARAELDRQLEENLLSYDAYFTALDAETRRNLDTQIELQRDLLAAATTSADKEKILAEIRELEEEKVAIVEQHARRRADLERALARQVNDLEAQQLRERGQLAEARRRELTQQFADLRARLVAENRTDAVRIIDSLIDTGVARERITEIEREMSTIRARRQAAEESVQTRVAAGVITERQAREELLGIYTRQRDAIVALLPALQAQAAITKSATDAQAVREYQNELEKLNLLIRQTGDGWFRVREQIRSALQSDLTSWLTDGIDQARTGAEALLNLLLSGLQSLRQIAAEALSREVVDGVRGLFGGGGNAESVESAATKTTTAAVALGAAGGAVQAGGAAVTSGAAALAGAAAAVMAAAIALTAASASMATAATIAASVGAVTSAGIPGLATGGYVRGPGTSTSDSILARLSDGEYVLRAAAVRRLGVDFLDALNGLRTPRFARGVFDRPRVPRFAQGGLVTAGMAGAGGGSIDGRLEVGLAPGLVAGEMNAFFRTPAGEATVLRVIARNPQVLRGIIG